MAAERLPPWFKISLGSGERYRNVLKTLTDQKLHTVCYSARCPNRGECWSEGTATFMILGDVCTRNCRFCAVPHGLPGPLDPEEPRRILKAVRKLDLSYVVVTSVTRDDLPDGGASRFAQVIRLLKKHIPDVRVEVLVPDFKGNKAAWDTVLDAAPDVFNHNIETVPRLYALYRPQAVYERSLALLRYAADRIGPYRVKSGLMLGMGETESEIEAVLKALLQHGVTRLTLGQYLKPAREHPEVSRYLTPADFQSWKQSALEMGFRRVLSGPLVRSSYHAGET